MKDRERKKKEERQSSLLLRTCICKQAKIAEEKASSYQPLYIYIYIYIHIYVMHGFKRREEEKRRGDQIGKPPDSDLVRIKA